MQIVKVHVYICIGYAVHISIATNHLVSCATMLRVVHCTRRGRAKSGTIGYSCACKYDTLFG